MEPQSVDYEERPLLYYFWLPAGKDEFGFDLNTEPPLRKTGTFRHFDEGNPHEETISQRFQLQWPTLKGNDSDLGGLNYTGDLAPHDADLGLRKVHFKFRYRHDDAYLTEFVPAGPIRGDAQLLSNGLYLWRFALQCKKDVGDNRLYDAVKSFLKDDFIKQHISLLFGFGWPSPSADALRSYKGVLTYYQLDLLLNGLFDGKAHPHSFFEAPAGQTGKYIYTIEDLIESASLFAIDGKYEPLFDHRNSYTLRGGHPVTSRIETSTELYGATTDADAQLVRDRLLSRLSNSAMEQFMRVAISFGVIYYKAGLDFCRGQLIDSELVSRINSAADELKRPSLVGARASFAEYEAYYATVSGKIPSLVYLSELIVDVAEVSRPVDSPDDLRHHEDAQWTDWNFSKASLDEAIAQYERQVAALQANAVSIERSLEAERSDQIRAELTESRKISEIAAESSTEGASKRGIAENQDLTNRLTFVALFLGILQVVSTGGVWLSQQFQSGHFFPPDLPLEYKFATFGPPVVLLIVALGFAPWLKRRMDWVKSRQVTEEAQVGGSSIVLDYSYVNREVDASQGAYPVLRDLCQNMRSLRGNGAIKEGALSIFQETPGNGVERTKYSVESVTEQEVRYVLHVEIDRRWATGLETLRDIRLVVWLPQESHDEVWNGGCRVIARCVKVLTLNTASPTVVNDFFRTHFGWQDENIWRDR